MASQSTLKTIIFKPIESGGTYANNTVYSWTVPFDWNDKSNMLHAIGAGGGAHLGSDEYGGAGGGGGAYANTVNIPLTPGSTLYFSIGAGGKGSITLDTTGTQGTVGGYGNSSWIGTASSEGSITSTSIGAKANGGYGGGVLSFNPPLVQGSTLVYGGAGGSVVFSVGTVTRTGGSGGAANNAQKYMGGAGGGAAASPTSDGGAGGTTREANDSGGSGGGGTIGNAANTTNQTGTAGGLGFSSTAGGTGGAGGTNGTAGGSGSNGSGGGGGGGATGSSGIAGQGGQGGTSSIWTDSTSSITAGPGGGGGGGGGGSGVSTTGGRGGLGGWHGGGGGASGGLRGTMSTISANGADGLIVVQYIPAYMYTNTGGIGIGTSGVADVTGIAAKSRVKTYKVTTEATNGVIALTKTKIAVTKNASPYLIWGNVASYGIAKTAKIRQYAKPTGTITSSGPTPSRISVIKDVDGSGKITVGGSSRVEKYTKYYKGTGSIQKSGIATTSKSLIYIVESKEIEVSGSIKNTKRTWQYKSSGGIGADGAAETRLNYRIYDYIVGAVESGGSAIVSKIIYYIPSGSIEYDGSAPTRNSNLFEYSLIGKFITSGSGPYSKTRFWKPTGTTRITGAASVPFERLARVISTAIQITGGKYAKVFNLPKRTGSFSIKSSLNKFGDPYYNIAFLKKWIGSGGKLLSGFVNAISIFNIIPRRTGKTISGTISSFARAPTRRVKGADYKLINLDYDISSGEWVRTDGSSTNLFDFIDDIGSNDSDGIITYVTESEAEIKIETIPRVVRRMGWSFMYRANTAINQPVTLTTTLLSDGNVIRSHQTELRKGITTNICELSIDDIYSITDGASLSVSFKVEDIAGYSNTAPNFIAQVTWFKLRRINKERRTIVN